MQCPACRSENPPGQKFCGECGARLESVCGGCGAANPVGQKFCGECGARLGAATTPSPAPPAAAGPALRDLAPVAYTPRHLADKILTSKDAIEGERKQVTVMFTDVSGFTAMSEALDPEDVHAIMDRVFEMILAAVHQYEGTINQFLGDGVMALFGAPIAHENHSERAIRAALAIQHGLQAIREDVRRTHQRDLRMRIGLNSGLVVVGAIGRDLRMDYTAVGDTVNLTSRVLNIAQPGQIALTRPIHRACRGLFEFEDLGDFQVKGKSEPVRVYAVTKERRAHERLEVSKERGLTPLVGRGEELSRLAGVYSGVADGQGGIALLVGDPGVGKSRLLYEFLRRVEADGVLELETSCASYGRLMAYRPIVELLWRYLGLWEGLGAEEIRRRVAEQHERLGLAGDDRSALVAHFLGVSAPPELLGRLSGPQLKDQTLAAVLDMFLRASEVTPLIVVVENLHWIDSASEDFLAHLAAGLPGHRVLLLLTTRPEYAAPWLASARATTIALDSLGAGDVRGMVRTLLGAADVSEDLLAILGEKSGGNPLYVEEILHQLRETGGITVDDGRAKLSRPDMTVPATIHDIIAARVDRLAEPQKHALQVAAVIGRRFGVSLESRVLGVPADDVASRLRELHARDFVFPAAEDPELMYSFKHALTQDVTYAGVLERRRRRYHEAAAVGLEDLYSERIDDVVELVAYHFGRAQVWGKAVTYLRKAAVKAQARAAYRESLASLEAALEALRQLPETQETQEQQVDVRIELRGALYPLGEFDKMLTYLREAERIATTIPDPRRLGLVSIHTAEYFRQTGQFAMARTLAEQARAQGDKLQDVPLQLYASHYLGLACHALGEYRHASDVLRGVTIASKAGWRTGAFAGMVNSSWEFFQAITSAWLARCLAERGEFDEAIRAGHRAVELAEETHGPYSLAAACLGLGYAYLARENVDAATPILERASSIAREANLALFRPQATRLLGRAYVVAGRIDQGLALARAAADEVEAKGLLMQHATALIALGAAYVAAGHASDATAVAQRALTLATERGQRGDAAAALQVLGEAAGLNGHVDTAEECFRAAIALAGELDMRPLLARAHLGLGRLYATTHDRERAEHHLLTARDLFIQLQMPLRLRHAGSVLDDLRRCA